MVQSTVVLLRQPGALETNIGLRANSCEAMGE